MGTEAWDGLASDEAVPAGTHGDGAVRWGAGQGRAVAPAPNGHVQPRVGGWVRMEALCLWVPPGAPVLCLGRPPCVPGSLSLAIITRLPCSPLCVGGSLGNVTCHLTPRHPLDPEMDSGKTQVLPQPPRQSRPRDSVSPSVPSSSPTSAPACPYLAHSLSSLWDGECPS